MQITMIIREFHIDDQPAVIALWHDVNLIVPHNDPQKDIERKLKVNPELFLVGEKAGQIIATVMGGYEGRRGWVNMLCVSPSQRGNGYARILMLHLEKLLVAKGCPKINLQVRHSNEQAIDFYKSIGYSDDHVFSMAKKITLPNDNS